jgi:transcriptional regulator with XRE-family HTH domain
MTCRLRQIEEMSEMSAGEFGEELRRLRHDRKVTLSDVSDATGISVPMLSRMERGERLPSDDTLDRLARFYGTHPMHFAHLAGLQHASHRYSRSISPERDALPPSPRLLAELDSAPYSEGTAASADVAPGPSVEQEHPVRIVSMAANTFSQRPITDLFSAEEESPAQAVDDSLQAAKAAMRQLIREYERAEAAGALTDDERRRLTGEVRYIRDSLGRVGR